MTQTSFAHKDILDSLNKNLTLKEKLVCTHEAIKQFFPFLARIAITIYDPATTLLKSYLDSSDDPASWQRCEARLEELPSLKEVLDNGRPHVINNMVTFENNEYGHFKRLGREGYAASYTMPFFDNGVFSGFIFFNSEKADVFTDDVLHELDIVGHMISLLVINELEAVHALTAAVKTTEHITHVRDTETGSHLDRMSHYSRLIAVADILYALTSDRSYKKAWSNDDAFAMLKKLAGENLDRDCVDAIIYNRKEVEEIQEQFKEDKFW